jgi:hypothetical protein
MLQITAGVSWSLKLTTEGIWKRVSVFIGSWFHCGIVYGKNECLYVSLEVCICLYVRGDISWSLCLKLLICLMVQQQDGMILCTS